ncbi:hypothetical protein Tco_0492131 [Tanacetum coccineum]
MAGLWFRMVRGDRTGFKETMLGVLLLQEIGELRTELEKMLMQAQESRVDLDEEQLLFLAGGQTNTFDDDVDEGPVQDMAQNEDNIFQADQCDAFDSDVDEAPTAQTLSMAISPLLIQFMMKLDKEDQVVQSDLSSVPNDAIMIISITNDIYEQDAQCVTSNKPNNTINASLPAELARYKELAKKENKLLEEFLDMKHLKEKVKDKLYKQDQSLQTIHMLCKPKSFYYEVNRVAIGYKNLFYLSKVKQVQPALYNGHEIVKTNHARALVHDSEDTLEIAETTRKQMIEKIKDPECVKKKVKIAPHDYSKENYFAKALKEKAKYAKPITAMTVYPPNTPAKLVPKVLPTKSQVQGIQKAFINEIKEMKEVFDQMEAEVDQNAVDKKCDEIERKNLLIENENLIAECLSKDVFYTAPDYVLTVSRFFDMHDAYTAAQKQRFRNKKSVTSSDALTFESVFVIGNLKEQLQGRGNTIRELEEKISCLQRKHSEADPIIDFKALDSQNKDLNAKLMHAKSIEKTNSLLTEIETLKAQIKGKMKCVTIPDPAKPKVLAPGMYAIDVEPIPPRNRNNREVHLEYLKYLKESVRTLREIVEEAKNPKKTNETMIPSIGVKDATIARGSKARSTTKKDRTLPWQSTGRKFTLRKQSPLTRFTKFKVVPVKQPESVSTSEIVITERLSNTSQKPLTRSYRSSFVRFGNDLFGAIMGYEDYVIGDSVISRVYYVEGLGHNLFFIGQICDSDLEVAFRKHSCYVRTEDGVDLLKGIKRPVPPALAVQVLVVSASIHSSTIIDQDAPSKAIHRHHP